VVTNAGIGDIAQGEALGKDSCAFAIRSRTNVGDVRGLHAREHPNPFAAYLTPGDGAMSAHGIVAWLDLVARFRGLLSRTPVPAETTRESKTFTVSALTTRVASSLADVGLTADEWNKLAAQSVTNSVFQTHEWTVSWLAAFGDEYEPLLVVAADDGHISGVAPLAIDTSQGERVIRFVGDGRADYCDFLGTRHNPEAATALVDEIFANDRWDILELNNVREDSETAAIVRGRSARYGYHVLSNEMYVCPTLLVAGHEKAARAIGDKPSLRRRENYFRRRGRLVCRDLKTEAEIAPYLDQFFEQHIERWSATGKSPSLFVDERNRTFYRHLTRSLTARDWLLFSVIEFDGEPIAFHFGFDYDSKVLWYKPSFNIKYAAAAPGLVMVQHLIRHAIGQHRTELDFTVGNEPFKRRFTNHERRTVRVRVFRDSLRFQRERLRGTVASAIKWVWHLGASVGSIA
jgi:CelD/BcsL family acetyltransferase involved in cellulose biosynthesis